MVPWSNSEKLRLLLLYKEGVGWASAAEKMNEEYRERPKSFFNEKNCKAEFERICNEPVKPIAPDEPSHSYKKSDVIDAHIKSLKEKVREGADRMVEETLVDLRKKTEIIHNIMSKDNRPPVEVMQQMLAKIKSDRSKVNRSTAEMEQVQLVEEVLRARFNKIFKERRESDDSTHVGAPPDSFSISPTKPSSLELQQAFRSPSPIKSPLTSPIRPLAEAIEEADAEMGDIFEPEEPVEEPKMEVESPVASPQSKTSSSKKDKVDDISSTVSPRTAADRAIGEGGLEEEMEEEEEEEEAVKEEPMEVEEKVEEPIVEKKEEEKPIVTRKSTRVSERAEITPVTPVSSGREGRDRRRKDPSPQSSADSSNSSKKEVEKKEKDEGKEKEEAKEEEGRIRRQSMRGRAPSLAVPTPITPVQSATDEKEKEEGGTKTRRSSRVERHDDKKEEKKEEKKVEKKEEKEEEETKRVTRRSALEKEGEKTEEKEKESKEEVTFVAPSVATRTRHHRGSEQTEEKEKEKEKSEEPSVPKTRGRHSMSHKSGSESKESPAPPEKRHRGRGEKREESQEKEKEKESRVAAGKEAVTAVVEKSLSAVGGRKDVEVLTEVSIRHPIAPPAHVSPSKTRRGTERESPVARKPSRTSSVSSASGKREFTSEGVQTDSVEIRHEDEVHVYFNANEHPFAPVCDIGERGRGRPKKEKEIKTETDEEKDKEKEKEKDKPVSRRTRGGGDVSEDEGGSRSGSFSQSDRGTPSRRKDSKRDMMTVHLDVDDDTGRYWLVNGATPVDLIEEATAPSSSSKKSRSSMTMEIAGRRSMLHMEPMKAALFKACKDMELHRHSSVFKANVAQKDAPDYYQCVHQPVCLATMKQQVQDGIISNPVALMRQFAIMFMNGAMYNSTAHDYWMYAVEMSKETYRPIREIMPEVLLEEEEGPKQTRARRNNEPAFAKDAMLCDRDRSMTLDRSFKCESVDGYEMDTSMEDHRALYSRSKVDSTRKRRI